MKLFIFLICKSLAIRSSIPDYVDPILAGVKSGGGNKKVQRLCDVNIRKSRAKLTQLGSSNQEGVWS